MSDEKVTAEQVTQAGTLYEVLLDMFVRQQGWVSVRQGLWTKGNKRGLTNEEAFFVETLNEKED